MKVATTSSRWNGPDWMLKDPTTKAEYDRYMMLRISLDKGDNWFPVYDMGFTADRPDECYYQLTETSPRIWLCRVESPSCWVVIDPRWDHDMNRSPMRYKDEYRGEAETWGPVPWDAFEEYQRWIDRSRL